MGFSESDALNDYGVILNMFDGFMEEIEQNDHLSLIYMMHSSELTGNSMT